MARKSGDSTKNDDDTTGGEALETAGTSYDSAIEDLKAQITTLQEGLTQLETSTHDRLTTLEASFEEHKKAVAGLDAQLSSPPDTSESVIQIVKDAIHSHLAPLREAITKLEMHNRRVGL